MRVTAYFSSGSHNDHAVMMNLHRPTDEKRMVAILPEDRYDAWLQAKASDSLDFIKPYPADLLATSTQES